MEIWLTDEFDFPFALPTMSSSLPPSLTWHNVRQDSVGQRNTKQHSKSVWFIVFHRAAVRAALKINDKAKRLQSEAFKVPCHGQPSQLRRLGSGLSAVYLEVAVPEVDSLWFPIPAGTGRRKPLMDNLPPPWSACLWCLMWETLQRKLSARV